MRTRAARLEEGCHGVSGGVGGLLTGLAQLAIQVEIASAAQKCLPLLHVPALQTHHPCLLSDRRLLL
jgi:hypothetical protein